MIKLKKMITNVTGLIDIDYQRVKTISVCGLGGGPMLGMGGLGLVVRLVLGLRARGSGRD